MLYVTFFTSWAPEVTLCTKHFIQRNVYTGARGGHPAHRTLGTALISSMNSIKCEPGSNIFQVEF
jgi:hypothetical protein